MIRKSDDPILSQDQIEYKCCSRCGDTRPTHWFGFCRRDNKPKNPCKPCLAKDRDALIARLTAKDTGQKYCVGCKKVLPFDNFWRDRSKADGRNTNCQDCRSQDDYQRDRRRRIRAARAIAPRDGYKVCHKCVEELPESWFAINNKKTGKLETICRVCNSRVPELMRNKLLAAEDNKRWCNKCETAKDDSEFSSPYTNGAHCKRCIHGKTRKYLSALRCNSDHGILPAIVDRSYSEQHGRCYYCRMPLKQGYHVDHMTPVSRGGGNSPDNLCCSCPQCNHQKTNKTVKEYIAWLAEKAAFCTLNERENAVLSNFE